MSELETKMIMKEASNLKKLRGPGTLRCLDYMVINWTKKIEKFAIVTERMHGSLKSLLQ